MVQMLTQLMWAGVLAASSGRLLADSIVCSAGNPVEPLAPVSCSSVPVSQSYAHGFAFSGNTVSGFSNISLASTSDGGYDRIYWIVNTFNDTILLPPAPVGDVLRVKVNYVAFSSGRDPVADFDGEAFSTIALGPGSPMSPELSLSTDAPCPFPSAGSHVCGGSETLPAAGYSFLNLQGEVSILTSLPGNYDNVYASVTNDITTERFKADGVSPDPFAPEPASFALITAGGLLLGLMLLRSGRLPKSRSQPPVIPIED